jgi:hypothetical protein
MGSRLELAKQDAAYYRLVRRSPFVPTPTGPLAMVFVGEFEKAFMDGIISMGVVR